MAKKKPSRGRTRSGIKKRARAIRTERASKQVGHSEELVHRADVAAKAAHEAAMKLPPFVVVGVGASAGGLEAYAQLLRAIPRDIGMAFVLVQHLAPQHDSILPELLSDATEMPVVQAAEGTTVIANRVYVAPPNAQVAIIDGKLHLVPRPEERGGFLPIDFFFRSLAEYGQGRAVGIVLSGTASDGAAGLREIKGAGGIAIAQEPKTAKYDGMPRAAISTGIVDFVLPPEEIGNELVRLARHPLIRPQKPAADEMLPMMDEQLNRIFQMLRNATGVDFTNYKQPTIKRRLQRRMVLHKITSIDQYIKFLQQNPAELQSLYSDILIHVTRFFRDPESFNVLTSKVFPKIAAERRGDEPIRIWVPGCSTGEEPYSIAIALLEFLGDMAAGTPIQVFATDISEAAIEYARAGVYPESIAADVSPERLRRFFTKTDGNYRINKMVRDSCIFARQDLTRDPPFSKLDLIVCRNVLIYLGPVLQKKVMTVFHYALKATGYLMLGAAETIGLHSDLFGVSDKRHKLYMKKVAVSRAAEIELPPVEHAAGRVEPSRKGPAEPRAGTSIQNEANRVVLSRHSPPGVIVDNDLQIVQFRGQTGPYLEPAPGEASLNLLKMAREGLLYALRTAIHEARKTGEAVRKEGLRVKHNGSVRDVELEVVPLMSSQEGRHFLVLFEETPARGAAAAEPRLKKKEGKKTREGENARVSRLQEELAASREYLQSIIQDLEAANEELQSANEEILSANEELQSTNEELDTAKEELQSTNEELNTVNEELQSRNEELSRANSDLVNLLANVQLAIVMVASDLRIRRFTPMAERVLNLIPTDVGRPIGDIKPNIDCPDLEKLIQEAIDTVTIVDRQVRDRAGNWYSLRIRPYKSVENRIDGAVLALIDRPRDTGEDSRVQAMALTDEHYFAEALLDIASVPLVVLGQDMRVRAANEAFDSAFGVAVAQSRGATIFDLAGGRLNRPEVRRLLDHIRDGNQRAEEARIEGTGDGRPMLLDARRIDRPDGSIILLAVKEGRQE